MAKWDNLLAILWLLKARKRITAMQIAETLEISVRTVYRYIDALCASGVPIIAESGHDGGYYLQENFLETPLFFASTELKAMVHAALFAKGAGYPFSDHLASALEKIQFHLNEEQMDYLKRHTEGFDVIAPARGHAMEPLLQQLEQAVANAETILIAYTKKKADNPVERKIDPYGLAYRFDRWYIVGFCHLRQDLRTFRVDRIHHFSPTGDTFERPSDFSIRDYLLNRFNSFQITEEPTILVQIAGKEKSLDRLAEHWYLRHYLVERRDEQIHFMMEEDTVLEYLPRLLITYGASIHILEPAVLKDKIGELVKELAQHYSLSQLP
ncbi:helix-turn-helix transcriptional regulator [Desmospora activa]|uniref:Putative DNA-binding transcriptional regulator YafY n=1 Tax=Desmospora activa DSM 45169 TaxID=1121389 RepID=A0A2T4ZDS7_9BACL|nr:YafY family protein [Desmospora activa]PTM60045.1 putative DNA-binding transcriptional regulator YafY [Desmospora activa DSM 45169]